VKETVRAQLLAVGSELTTGDTVDTNSAEIARRLTALGVSVLGARTLPDDLTLVTDAIRQGLDAAEVVITTGGLGPTPDDLTREAIAAACGEGPVVDPTLDAWLRDLFARRGLEMAERNRKQAWLIPSAQPLANEQGTAPGWWVERPGGRVIVALPGPPREMRPMWADAEGRLRARGIGADHADVTLRLAGIGESAVAELIGDALLAAADPSVATYARADAVEVRIRSGGAGAFGRVAAVAGDLRERLGAYLFGEGDEGWPEALGRRLDGRTVAVGEVGTGGQVAALLAPAPWFRAGEVLGAAAALAEPTEPRDDAVDRWAARVRHAAGADVGLAVRARERGGDMAVSVGIATAEWQARETRTAFLTGDQGRQRAAIAACAVLWRRLGQEGA
jgi:nicotinamide-nucleotide amidase